MSRANIQSSLNPPNTAMTDQTNTSAALDALIANSQEIDATLGQSPHEALGLAIEAEAAATVDKTPQQPVADAPMIAAGDAALAIVGIEPPAAPDAPVDLLEVRVAAEAAEIRALTATVTVTASQLAFLRYFGDADVDRALRRLIALGTAATHGPIDAASFSTIRMGG